MIFVEGFRLLLVIAGALIGLTVGNHVDRFGAAPVIGVLLGAAVAYVVGGVGGRLIDRGLRGAVGELRRLPASEVFAAAVLGSTGLLLGLVAALPLVALVHSSIDYPLVAALAWVLCALGVRLGSVKGRDLSRALGLTRLLEPPGQRIPAGSLVLDTSAVLHRQLLVLGTHGLLPGGLVVPRFVAEEVQALAEGPDPVSARRARRGLEALQALEAAGVAVHLSEETLPEVDGVGPRTLELARRSGGRLGTCSAALADAARALQVEVLDLRRLAAELAPDHPAGERLRVDLVRPGRQPRQAVGYLPEGDMVVVNDAAHLVGREAVEVVVSSTRHTSQGLLVFAHLPRDGVLAEAGS